MHLLSPIEKSQSTLYSSTNNMSTSTKSIGSYGSSNGGVCRVGTVAIMEDQSNGEVITRGNHAKSENENENENANRSFCFRGDSVSGEDDDEDDESDSDLSFNECGDITLLVDDGDMICDPKNEAEMMFLQVVEMLRYEQEVCVIFSCFCLRFLSQI